MVNTNAPSSSPDKELLVFIFRHHHALNTVMIPVQIESEQEAGPMAGAAERPLESSPWKQRRGARSASASPLPKKSSSPRTHCPRCLVKHAQLHITEYCLLLASLCDLTNDRLVLWRVSCWELLSLLWNLSAQERSVLSHPFVSFAALCTWTGRTNRTMIASCTV